MIDQLPDTSSAPLRSPSTPAARRLARIQFGLCLMVTAGMLVYLLWTPSQPAGAGAEQQPASSEAAVRLNASGQIEIQPDSPLQRKLQITTLRPASVASAVLNATGTVVASLRPAPGQGKHWQFNSPELLTTHTDWQKAIADIAFARKQLDSIRQLAENRVRSQAALVTRLQQLVEAGTDTERDLAAARTELLQTQIQGQKDTHEAETALRLARRTEAALARQLQQAGLDPDLLGSATAELDIVVADVPEASMSAVRLGQSCQASFFGVPGQRFRGVVRSISPVLSRERRSLRVLYTIDDPEDLLRPGMFAELGLDTDSREALLVPLTGVVHLGLTDYVLAQDPSGSWQPTAVQVGEVRGEMVEILSGLKKGDRVISQGAILLKPLMVEALQRPLSPGPGAS